MGRGLCLELSRRDRKQLDELLRGGLQPVRTVLRALALRQMEDGESTRRRESASGFRPRRCGRSASAIGRAAWIVHCSMAAGGVAGAEGACAGAGRVAAASRRDAQSSGSGRRFIGSPLSDWLRRCRARSLRGGWEIGQLQGDGGGIPRILRFSSVGYRVADHSGVSVALLRAQRNRCSIRNS